MDVLFYANRNLLALLIRLLTWDWRHGQRWADVPSHCAVCIRDYYSVPIVYEFIWGFGFNNHVWLPRIDNDAEKITFALADPCRRLAMRFADTCRGDRYDATALLCSLIDEGLPADYQFSDTNHWAFDCSRFVMACLVKAGVLTPMMTPTLGGSPSPNALKLYLRARLSATN